MSDLGDTMRDMEHGEREELISRLRVIEGQPLPERAPAYAQVHAELAAELDAGSTAGSAPATHR